MHQIEFIVEITKNVKKLFGKGFAIEANSGRTRQTKYSLTDDLNQNVHDWSWWTIVVRDHLKCVSLS